MVEVEGDSRSFISSKILIQQDLLGLEVVIRALETKTRKVRVKRTTMQGLLTASDYKEQVITKLKQFAHLSGVEKVIIDFRNGRAFAYILLDKDYVLVTNDAGEPVECEQVQALIRLNIYGLVSASSTFANSALIMKYSKNLDKEKRLHDSPMLEHPYISRGVPCWGVLRTINADLKLRYLRLQESATVTMVLDNAWETWNLADIVSVWRAYLAQDLTKAVAGTSEYRNLLAVSEKEVGRHGKGKKEEQNEIVARTFREGEEPEVRAGEGEREIIGAIGPNLAGE